MAKDCDFNVKGATPRENVSLSMHKMRSFRFTLRMRSLIRTFAPRSYILQCPLILLADREGLDQTARMHSLGWAGPRLAAYARRHVFACRVQIMSEHNKKLFLSTFLC